MTAKTDTSAIGVNGQPLIIEAVEIPVEFKKLPIAQLELDPDNPRIQHAVRQKFNGRKIRQEDLLALIYEQPGVSELYAAIRDNGGLMEPIFVRPNGRVIEGNCRAMSYLKLHAAKPKEEAWKAIPALVVPNITDRQVAILQGSQHVAGKNKWRAYEKVGHLHFMHVRLGMDVVEIARTLGLRKGPVEQDLAAYKTMTEKLLPKMGTGNELQKWSYVQEFHKNKHLAEYRSKPEHVDEFVSMVAEGRFKRGEEVRKLHQVMAVPAAFRALKKKDITAALSEAGKVDPTVNSSVMKKLKNVTSLLKQVPAKELQELMNEDSSRQIFSELVNAIREAARTAKVRLT